MLMYYSYRLRYATLFILLLGLFLQERVGAQTGPQGSMSEASGNKWFANGTDAQFAGGNPGLSPYFARPNNIAPNEFPVTIIGPSDWFRETQAPPACINCTVAQPLTSLPISSSDELIANDALYYTEYDAAMRWWNRWNLYAKLGQTGNNPNWPANILSFKTNMGTAPLGRLADIRRSIREIGTLPLGTLGTLASEQAAADSLAALFPSGTAAGDEARRAELAAAIEAHYASAENILANAFADKQQQASALLIELMAISTGNAYETSEKTVLGAYLRHVALGEPITTTALDQLLAVGDDCPLVNGPAVYAARGLYRFFTGITLPEVECPAEVGERSDNLAGAMASVALSPNPASDRLQVTLNGFALDTPVELSVYDLLGRPVLRQKVQQTDIVDISTLRPGTYWARLSQGGKVMVSVPLSVIR